MLPLNDVLRNSKLDREAKKALVKSLFGFSQEDILKNPEALISQAKAKRFESAEKKISQGEAYQYVTGRADFYGREFYINKDVLIPCPETEILAEMAVDFLRKKEADQIDVLDLATGSGVIIATIALELPNQNARLVASDISQDAIEVALKNFSRYDIKVDLIKSDLFKKIQGDFDLITANLPYGAIGDPDYKNLPYPKISVLAGGTGFELIADCLMNLDTHLKSDGLALFEIGHNHREQIRQISNQLKQFKLKIVKDLNGYDRVLAVSWKKPQRA